MQGRQLPRVRVKRRSYTDRSFLHPNRRNYLLKFEMEVPENSYLLTSSGLSKLDYSKLERKFKEILRKVSSGKEDIRRAAQILEKHFDEIRRSSSPSRNEIPRYDDVAILPGSSIKGAVRSRVEYKLKPVKTSKGYESASCYSVVGQYNTLSKAHMEFWYPEVIYPRERCGPKEFCVVCDLFGSQGLGSRVYFSLRSRVYFSDGILMKGGPVRLDGYGEAFSPGSKFSLEVTCENSTILDLGLLFLGTEQFSGSPILLGGRKYAFNPKTGGKYKNEYFFGLVTFKLKEILEFEPNGKKETIKEEKEIQEKINEARKKLIQEIGEEYIGFEEGVIK
ncbi:MAG TPA: hypothetical protein ENF65_00645 [Euryarchaeota archaeon]|nr:hypothetical protein [Euryarchaeota archaeon]